jgi:hypothetical protein
MNRYPRLYAVEVQPNHVLLLHYENGEHKLFDVKPYLSIGIFRKLRDDRLFQTVHVSFDTIAWCNGADIEPEELYKDSVPADPERIATD